MRRRACPAALLAALLGAGCAAPGLRPRATAPSERARPLSIAGARAGFTPPSFRDVFAAAVEVVRGRGLDIVECEAPRGALATAPVEMEAPCGGTICLARETTSVKLGYRRARVIVTREVWDPTLRAWREQGDPETVEELSDEEQGIVSRILEASAASAASSGRADRKERGRVRRDPCAPAPCADGTCVATRTPASR